MKNGLIALTILCCLGITACGSGNEDTPTPPTPTVTPTPDPEPEPEPEVKVPTGKAIYIPYDFKDKDLTKETSEWCYQRARWTDDIIVFWAKGFGNDLSKAPSLQGQNMKVAIDNLLKKLQEFYDYYYDTLKFVTAGKTKADKYRMMVMLDYSLEGTAYGGSYDNEIGALWIAPNRVQDKNLNACAHEIGHSFQLQIIADGEGDAWGGSGFYEMTSQWMLWQVNPDWTSEEYYHLEAFKDATHKAFLHLDNIYRSPYVIEMWGQRHGLPFIADLFRNGKIGEDPVMTYKRLAGVDQEAFNDEMWDNYAHLVNWDIDRVREKTKGYRDIWHTSYTDAGDGWQRVAKANCPENYGFNIYKINNIPASGKVTVEFRGEAGANGYVNMRKDAAGWRYGFVAVDDKGKVTYSTPASDPNGSIVYEIPEGAKPSRLHLVVMGAPTQHWMNPENGTDAQWPYSIRITND